MKNKIFILFCFIFLLTIGTINAVSAISIEDKNNINDKKLKSNSEQSEIGNKIDKLLKVNDSYPSYYGGMYITEDSKYLILQIVKDNLPTTNDEEYNVYNEILKISDSVKIEYVENSYIELKNIYDSINEYYKKYDYIVKKAEFNNYVGHYIDIKNNVVVVKFMDDTNINQEIKKFKKLVIDSEIIKYSKGEDGVDESDLDAGAGISVTNGTCSMGYRVRVLGQNGYITAGHCFNANNVTIMTGKVKNRQYSGSVDAAFVATNTFYTPTNNLAFPNSSNTITYLNSTMCPVLILGQTIAHDGYTTHYQSGSITSLSYSHTFNGVLFTNLILTNYSSSGGDSGGPAFIPSTTYGGKVAGIHKGSTEDGKVVVNADYIESAFNYVRY